MKLQENIFLTVLRNLSYTDLQGKTFISFHKAKRTFKKCVVQKAGGSLTKK